MWTQWTDCSLRSTHLEAMGARKNGARKGDMLGERECLPEGPIRIVFTHFLSMQKISIGLEAPEGIRVGIRQENCQSNKIRDGL